MVRPFFPLVVALVLGIISSYYFQFTVAFVLMLLVFFVLIFIYSIISHKNIQYILISILFLLGILISTSNNSILTSYIGKNIEFEAIVDEVIDTTTENGRYIIKVDKLNGKFIKSEKVMLSIISNKDLKLGDKINIIGILKEPMANTNPKLYNYKLNLMSQKIFTTITIKNYGLKNITHEPSFRYRVKSSFTNKVENLFNPYLNERNSELITSIILGNSSYINEDNLILYRELGLAHILAVSGLHIGIISGFLIFIFSRLGIKRRINVMISLSIIWCYGFLIGYPPSILRASIMFSLLFYSTVVHEPYDSINTLSIACFILLILNPYYLFNLGFQLSFGAAFSIVYFTPFIKIWFYPYKSKLTNTLAALLAVNIGLFPIQAYYFNKVGLLAILANLILIPIFSISLILGLIMLICSYTLSFINIIIGPFLNMLLNLQYYILKIIPNISLKVFSPDSVHILLYFIIVLILLKIIKIENYEKSIRKSIVAYLIILSLFNTLGIYKDKSIELHFIDVGQGDSILIRTQDGDYLMDTGGSPMENAFDISKNITLPYLEKLGIKGLKAIIISHFHDDHSEGVPLLVENLIVDNIVGSYSPEGYKLPVIVLKQNDEIMLDKNTKLSVIWPGNLNKTNENNNSLVALLSYYEKKILFTGDIEKEVEPLIGDLLMEQVHILKVPHHGSSTSSTEELIKKLMPINAIISVGRNNMYNHPSNEVLARYESINSTIFRTDKHGLIKVKLSEEDYRIKSFIKEEKINLLEFTSNNILIICFYLLYIIISYILIRIKTFITEEMTRIEL